MRAGDCCWRKTPFQSVQAGDATALDEGDVSFKSDTTVLSPAVNSGSLVGSFDLAASVITPNGDGINDVLDMECEVLAVDGGQIAVNVYDLGGRWVRRLFDIEGSERRLQLGRPAPTAVGRDRRSG